MKRKKKYYLGTFLIILSLVLGGYFYFRHDYGYRSAIPSDAQAIMEVDLSGLARDCGFTLTDLVSHYDKLDGTGLDFSVPVYGFLTRTGNFAMLVALKDGDDFDETLEQYGFETENQRGMVWSNVGSWVLVRDKQKVLVMGPASMSGMDAMREEMAALMIKGGEDSPILLSLEEESGHMKFVSNITALPDNIIEYVGNLLPKGSDLSSLKLVSGLTTHDDKLVLNVRLQSYDEALMSEFRKFNEALRPIQGNLMEDAPADPVVWMGCNTDGNDLLRILRKNPEIRQKLVMANLCVDADRMLQAVNGDISFAIPYLKLGAMDMMLTAEVQNTDFLSDADSWQEGIAVDNGMRMTRTSPGDFHISYEGFDGYFGVCKKNSLLYVTNSSDLQKVAGERAVSSTYADMRKDIVGCIFFSSINLSRILYAISPYAMIFGPNQRAYKILNSVDRLNIRVPDCTEFTIELKLKENIKNVLLD